jgi:hypothetical protein
VSGPYRTLPEPVWLRVALHGSRAAHAADRAALRRAEAAQAQAAADAAAAEFARERDALLALLAAHGLEASAQVVTGPGTAYPEGTVCDAAGAPIPAPPA